ncbi:MAG TPA: hypothetical protein DDW94_11705 [Deltaproteobacteria bacterium]|nr:MAG: hypothetical protein A2Z79_05260 [Deltaproteobacteria bacterium GWA2_55_82]OGQ63817.1 MAG: hypothetical protein A3I81_12390 [Deltaproteobacteria bacterium RIFCSPLOWO2_02_FULL_55_12]OIJ72724.1 MAG: hypothetical protein A2V21_312835 [Deltaproteobacteria bacterium GWC2_55_46]HBG47635.1 hypothetical protein [Deltaproteobacteria bacterium]HCY10546.1 hypothetical protein [Deltaproteobacteria bacterium]
MNPDIKLTAHAVERFVERSRKLGMKVRSPEDVILKLLSKATPEDLSPAHRVKRLIKNGCREATYLVNNGWRFVVVDNAVTTIERIVPHQN